MIQFIPISLSYKIFDVKQEIKFSGQSCGRREETSFNCYDNCLYWISPLLPQLTAEIRMLTFLSLPLLLSMSLVIALKAESPTPTPTPIVMWHGMGDSCCNPFR